MDPSVSVGPPAPGVLVEVVGADIVLYGPATKQFFTLNHTAAAVWRHADGTNTVADVAAVLSETYGVPAADIVDDVAAIVEQLQEACLLRVSVP